MNRNRWLTLIGLILIGALLFVTGCGGSSVPADQGGNDGAAENGSVSLMIAGSDSEVNLVTRLAEEYMNANSGVAIAVTGGGSGVGISSLIDGNIDIANSSRPMKESEEADLKAKQGQDAYAVRFAVDGVAVVVHKDNPVVELTVDQIGAIYRGEITNWSEVGGENLDITLYGRQSTSGTYVFFMEKVVQADYSPEMRNLAGTSDIVEAVTNDLGGIGYAAIGYATKDGIKAVLVAADEASEAFDPTILENVTSGKYPLTRPLYQFVIGKPTGAILDFLLYEVGETGQQLILEEGFYPITDADKEFNQKALQ